MNTQSFSSLGKIESIPSAVPIRQAALLVHSMNEVDRGWILSQLTISERKCVEQLLPELTALGIIQDASFLNFPTSAKDSSSQCIKSHECVENGLSPTIAVNDITSMIDAIDRVRPETKNIAWMKLSQSLRGEPPALIAELFSIWPWSWKAELLKTLPDQYCIRIPELLEVIVRRTESPLHLQRALLSQLHTLIYGEDSTDSEVAMADFHQKKGLVMSLFLKKLRNFFREH